MASRSETESQHPSVDLAEVLSELSLKIERLKTLYEQYFMGIEKAEPQVARKEVTRIMLALQQQYIRNTALRFKFNTMLQKWNIYITYWNRTLREIENGTYTRHLAKARRAAERTGRELPAEMKDRRPPSGTFAVTENTQESRPNFLDVDTGSHKPITLDGAEDDLDLEQIWERVAPSESKPISVGAQWNAGGARASATSQPPPTGGRPSPGSSPSIGARPTTVTRDSQSIPISLDSRPIAVGASPPGARPTAVTRDSQSIPISLDSKPIAVGASPPGGRDSRPIAVPPRPPSPPAVKAPPPRAPSPPPPPSAAMLPKIPGMSEPELRALHQRYNDAQRQGGGGSAVRYETLVQSLAKQVPRVLEQPGVKGVRFDVSVQNGKPILKAIPQK